MISRHPLRYEERHLFSCLSISFRTCIPLICDAIHLSIFNIILHHLLTSFFRVISLISINRYSNIDDRYEFESAKFLTLTCENKGRLEEIWLVRESKSRLQIIRAIAWSCLPHPDQRPIQRSQQPDFPSPALIWHLASVSCTTFAFAGTGTDGYQ